MLKILYCVCIHKCETYNVNSLHSSSLLQIQEIFEYSAFVNSLCIQLSQLNYRLRCKIYICSRQRWIEIILSKLIICHR